MKKTLVPLILTVIVLAAVFIARFAINGGEDNWICVNGQWVKHGQPKNPPPETGCGTVSAVSPSPESKTAAESEIGQSPVPSQAAESTSEAIARDLGRKYNRPADAFIIKTTTDTGKFAKGTVGFKDEPGGGLWFGAKTDAGWVLVFDGNGIMDCASADKYALPKDMAPNCLDTKNGNQLIQR